jgi:hypothetical protein
VVPYRRVSHVEHRSRPANRYGRARFLSRRGLANRACIRPKVTRSKMAGKQLRRTTSPLNALSPTSLGLQSILTIRAICQLEPPPVVGIWRRRQSAANAFTDSPASTRSAASRIRSASSSTSPPQSSVNPNGRRGPKKTPARAFSRALARSRRDVDVDSTFAKLTSIRMTAKPISVVESNGSVTLARKTPDRSQRSQKRSKSAERRTRRSSFHTRTPLIPAPETVCTRFSNAGRRECRSYAEQLTSSKTFTISHPRPWAYSRQALSWRRVEAGSSRSSLLTLV